MMPRRAFSILLCALALPSYLGALPATAAWLEHTWIQIAAIPELVEIAGELLVDAGILSWFVSPITAAVALMLLILENWGGREPKVAHGVALFVHAAPFVWMSSLAVFVLALR